jgi:ribose transport system permease protein
MPDPCNPALTPPRPALEEATPAPARRPARSLLGRGGWLAEAAERGLLLAVWALMIAVFSITESGTFDSSGTWQTIFGSQAALVFLSMGLLCTIVVGEFVDLSVASILGLSATLIPVLSVLHHVNVAVASVLAVLAGTGAGAVNGFFVVVVGVNVIVVTLGTSTLLLGIALLIAHLSLLSGLSPAYAKISTLNIGGLPISFFYGLALVLAIAYVLGLTPLGRSMQFVGANREVSRLAGVRVNRIRFGSFVVAGFLCGLGGVVVSSGLGGFDPSSSVSYLLPTVSAVFLGTAVIQPGKFNPVGTVIAIYFLATGILGIEELGASGWISDVFYGTALIAAVSLSTLVRRRRSTG